MGWKPFFWEPMPSVVVMEQPSTAQRRRRHELMATVSVPLPVFLGA